MINESYLECKFREAWANYGGDLVLVQEVPLLANGKEYRVDFLHIPTAHIVELDGLAFHSSREAQRKDRAKRRDLTGLGWRFLEYTYDDIEENVVDVIDEIKQRLNDTEPVPADAFSINNHPFSVDDFLQMLLAQGFKYRESNVLRNPASLDFRGAASSTYANRQQSHETPYSHRASNTHYPHQGESKKVEKLLPKLDGNTLMFVLSGFLGPVLGASSFFVLLLVLDALILPLFSLQLLESDAWWTTVVVLGSFPLGLFIGWHLLIRLAKTAFEHSKIRLPYNILLVFLSALYLYIGAPSILENFIQSFDDFLFLLLYIISFVSGFLGFLSYVRFWQERQ